MKIFKLMRSPILFLFVLMMILPGRSFGQSNKGAKEVFIEGVLIVKLKQEHRAFFTKSSAKADKSVFDEILKVNRTFPKKAAIDYRSGEPSKMVDLSRVYTLNTTEDCNMNNVQEQLLDLGVFEYVEQKRARFTTATPNDPLWVNQSYLSQINAQSAWDVTIGSTLVKIGVVDTGTDTDHPDLVSELWENSADPINGIDDDNDGYVDNFAGWDFVENDNNPQAVASDHGVHVSGIAAAATNNNVGISSVGYQTLYVPVRVGNGSLIEYGYEGIVYAADLGCDIINCSWGGFGSSQYEEDIINYATYNKDALVICAAGNQNRDQVYYPAGYENALGVASVNSSDEKSSFTNHGYWVGLCAPGEQIYSTVDNGMYNYNTGTSMAAPVVSGAAALVKAVYPQLSALQIAAQLKATSVNVDGLNGGFEHKLGVGRLNVGTAVSTPLVSASVEFGNVELTNNTDNVFKGNDSLFISGTFTNYLATSGNVVATISTSSAYVTLNNTAEQLGVMSSTLQKDNYSTPFSCKILPNAPLNETVVFEVTTTDGDFTNSFFVPVVVNVDFLNVAINKISTSVGSKGQFGYNTDDQSQGLGMQLENAISQLYEGGVMIGSNTGGTIKVADRVRNSGTTSDDDFSAVQNVHVVTPSPKGDYYITGIFNDANTFADSMGITVTHSAYAYTEVGHDNYVVLEYTVLNSSNADITDLNIGLFADFDLNVFNENKVFTDTKRFITYTASSAANQPVFGVQLLSPTSFVSYGLDNVNGGNGGVDIRNNYPTDDKFLTMTTRRYNAGFATSKGNDVIQVTSTGGFTLAPGDSVTAAFALLAANHISLLEKAADSAYFRYNGSLPNSVNELSEEDSYIHVYPNPVNDLAILDMSNMKNTGSFQVNVFDIAGNKVHPTLVENSKTSIQINTSSWSTGVYFVEVTTKQQTLVTKLVKY